MKVENINFTSKITSLCYALKILLYLGNRVNLGNGDSFIEIYTTLSILAFLNHH